MASFAKPIRLYEEPHLENPYLVAAWPGIGNIGLISVNYLKERLEATEIGEIEPFPFFFPHGVTIENGVLKELEFPKSKFYCKRGEKDLLIFLGEMQPSGEKEVYQLANYVLDVAQHFGVKRVYTAGAAVASIHHAQNSRVWAVPNTPKLISDLKEHAVVLMSEIEGRSGQGSITGLNGLLLGVAKKRNLEGICFLGEVPIYIANFPVPYPKASRAVLDILTSSLGVTVDFAGLDYFAQHMEREIEKLYSALPVEVREQLDKLKEATPTEPTQSKPITEEDKERILKDLEEFFGKGRGKQT